MQGNNFFIEKVYLVCILIIKGYYKDKKHETITTSSIYCKEICQKISGL